MKTLSAPALVKLVLAIICFAFIFVILYYMFRGVGYAGRWNCKLAYSIAAPLGLFMDKNAAMQDVGLKTAIATGVAVAGLVAAYAIGKKFDITPLTKATSTILKNKYFQTAATTAIIGGIGLYALGNAVNTGLSHLQKPIVKNMCRMSNVEIDINKWDNSYLNKCIEDIKKEVKNANKISWINQYFGTNSDRSRRIRLCLAYQIARHIIYTFGETIGASVNMPFAHTHYAIVLKNSGPLSLTVADIIAVFDLIDIKENETFYEIFYQKSGANAEPTGEIYNLYNRYCNSKSRSFSVSKDNKYKESIKLIGIYYDSINNQEKEDYIIYNSTYNRQLYIILIKYTGLGEIVVISTRIS
ncbi:MAG: hypothetical protein QXW13_02210 [Nanopusillaceae archaeon]